MFYPTSAMKEALLKFSDAIELYVIEPLIENDSLNEEEGRCARTQLTSISIGSASTGLVNCEFN